MCDKRAQPSSRHPTRRNLPRRAPRLGPDEAWVSDATRGQGAHVEPGVLLPISEFGYGYHWWLPGQAGEFAAIGVYNQYVYVDAKRSVVIAKFSANRNWGIAYAEPGYRDHEHIALFRALAAEAAASP